MKQIIISARSKIRKILQSGKNRCRKLVEKSSVDRKSDSPAVQQQVSSPGTQGQTEPRTPEVKKAGRTGKNGQDRKPKREPPWSLEQFPVVPAEGKSRFHDFAIPLRVMHAIADQQFEYCTPIQEKSLAHVLAGKDLVGKANTGTGKTAVFLIAIVARLLGEKPGGTGAVRSLVLAPTRELVVQIAKDARGIAKYSNLSVRMAYGGVDYQKQQDLLKDRRCDILVATPGRLLDFLGKGVVDLSRCRVLVLDEADRMLDMGFIPDVRRIVGRLPSQDQRQTMLFSATVPDDVKRLASQWCVKPKVVEAEPEQVAVETVEQVIYLTTAEEKYRVLYNLIQAHPDDRIIVFANMKNEAKRLADRLGRNGVECVLLSGDVAQDKRMKRLENFREGKVKILVATDVAGRGIHIEGITFVVNYTLPYEPEDYVHRIGRTGRAGAEGKAVSFACEEGSFYLPDIEEYIGNKFNCTVPEESLLAEPPPEQRDKPGTRTGGREPGKKRRRSGRRQKNRTPVAKKSGSSGQADKME
ncbi:DEAD/DEAH box helicase [Desulforhopalus singaporensis]|uniref:ATP-dependent RNA helicase RhlB n=1 Tax=Desulforhopalus singaporensis TaxID=91360 RepID=A0A1H0Q988_9BACT|nr:DEAD/DEAH box helicase [Desulforhopalus singaporensis]SDP13932.1 ATP-dependent RNA helicase RhlB [Desulforhopalus singaporensis]